MYRLIFFLIGFLVFVQVSFCQVLYRGEAALEVEFNKIKYLPSGDSILTLSQAKQKFQEGAFIENNLETLNLGIAKDNYWVTFSLLNETDSNERLFCILGNPRLNDISVYVLSNDTLNKQLQMGDNFPFYNRPLNINQFAFEISSAKNARVEVFLFVKHKGNTLQMPITIRNTNSLISGVEAEYLETGFITGIFAITFFFGLFFLYNTRDPLFISYSGYLITAAFWVWTTEGFAFQYLWPNATEYTTRLAPGISAVSACFFIANCLQFTRPYDPGSRLRKILIGLFVGLCIWSITPFIPFIPLTGGTMSTYLSVYFICNLVIALLMIFYLLRLVNKGHRVVLYFFIAVLSTIFSAVIVVLKASGIITTAIPSSTIMSGGYILELILMTAGITKQFYNYRIEKEQTLLAYLDQQKNMTEKIIETQTEERKRIGRELHDDVGAGLTQISLMSEVAKNYTLSNRSNAKELDDIANTARQLVETMSEIIWALHPDNKTLNQLLVYMREHLYNLLEYSGIEYKIEFPMLSKEIPLSNVHLRNILMIVKESVNNAIKYSKSPTLLISCNVDADKIYFEVKDQGIGLNPQQVKKGNGQINMKRRASVINGTFELISETNKGTLCRLTVPYIT